MPESLPFFPTVDANALAVQLFESSADCVKLLTLDGRIAAINRNGCHALELEEVPAPVGRLWESLLPEGMHAELTAAIRAARQGKPAHFSLYCPTVKGTPKWWDVSVTPVGGRAGDVEHLLVVSRDVTAMRHAGEERERLLKEEKKSQERLILASDAAELGLWSWDPVEDKVIWENKRPYDVFGLPLSSPAINAARFIDEFVHPDDAGKFNEAVGRTLETGARFSFQGRIRRPDGELRWVEFSGQPQSSAAGGTPREILGTMTDITARKTAEIALFESRERFEKIVSQAATGVVQMDTHGRITLANQKYCEMLGYTEAELLGTNVIDVTAPGSVAATCAAVEKLLDGNQSHVIEKQYLRKDGTLMSATSSLNALRGQSGEYQGLVAIVLDTTASKHAADELRASEERYRTLFESMDQGFCILDMIFDPSGRPVDYRFLEMNRKFEEHTGLVDAAGKTARQLVPDLDSFWFDTYGRVALTGETVRFESEAKAIGRWFDVYATRIGGPGTTKVALLFSDITARKLADKNLRQLADDLAETDRRKTEFLATLAHELRNPLAPIRSGLGVMRLSGDNQATLTKIREMMERQVSHMVHLIDDLLDIARISGGKLELKKERSELKTILSTAVETSLPLIEAGQHALTVDVPDDPLPIDADTTRVAQVVANLLNNAAKYTPAGGRIRLSLQREEKEAVIAVSDTGVGIPKGALGSIFEMFSQVSREIERSQGGLGIGLALVRRLVEMHGGTIRAESAGNGKGSTFVVRLPLAHDAVAVPAAALPQERSDEGTQSHRILIVDDNEDAAMTLAMIFEVSGYAVQVAHDGYRALEKAAGFQPHVVFLDIGMPGMDGHETARKLRQLPGLGHALLVALTGWGADNDRALSKDAGFNHHLTKPVELATVRHLLAKHFSSDSAPHGGG